MSLAIIFEKLQSSVFRLYTYLNLRGGFGISPIGATGPKLFPVNWNVDALSNETCFKSVAIIVQLL